MSWLILLNSIGIILLSISIFFICKSVKKQDEWREMLDWDIRQAVYEIKDRIEKLEEKYGNAN